MGGNIATAERWFGKLAKLNVYRARGGAAPHKPLMLLVVLELAEQGLLPRDVLPLTPDLAFRFLTYWRIVAHRRTQRPDVRLPFHHLSRDGFWLPLQNDGEPSPDHSLTEFAALTADFVAFATDPVSRDKGRRILVAKYFEPAERAVLYSLAGMAIPTNDDITHDANFRPHEGAKRQGREMRFRLDIVAAYNYSCALTGYRLATLAAGSIVDAAHIHQFADSRNNDPRNGLALCKNAHWLFDNGLWTIADDYSVVVAVDRFSEESPDHKPLRDYHGRRIRLPSNSAFWPNPIHLAWHRNNVFQA